MITELILATISGIFFVIPFFIWGIIRFIDKQKRDAIYWKKTALIFSFSICYTIGVILIILAFVL